jgi:hypothetical protein
MRASFSSPTPIRQTIRPEFTPLMRRQTLFLSRTLEMGPPRQVRAGGPAAPPPARPPTPKEPAPDRPPRLGEFGDRGLPGATRGSTWPAGGGAVSRLRLREHPAVTTPRADWQGYNVAIEAATVEICRPLKYWTTSNESHVIRYSYCPRSTGGKAIRRPAISAQPSFGEGPRLPRCREDAGGSGLGRGTGQATEIA